MIEQELAASRHGNAQLPAPPAQRARVTIDSNAWLAIAVADIVTPIALVYRYRHRSVVARYLPTARNVRRSSEDKTPVSV